MIIGAGREPRGRDEEASSIGGTDMCTIGRLAADQGTPPSIFQIEKLPNQIISPNHDAKYIHQNNLSYYPHSRQEHTEAVNSGASPASLAEKPLMAASLLEAMLSLAPILRVGGDGV